MSESKESISQAKKHLDNLTNASAQSENYSESEFYEMLGTRQQQLPIHRGI